MARFLIGEPSARANSIRIDRSGWSRSTRAMWVGFVAVLGGTSLWLPMRTVNPALSQVSMAPPETGGVAGAALGERSAEVSAPEGALLVDAVSRKQGSEKATAVSRGSPGLPRVSSIPVPASRPAAPALSDELSRLLPEGSGPLRTRIEASNDGWVVSGVSKKSLFDRLGLRSGDTLLSVDGAPVGASEVTAVLLPLLQGRGASAYILRDGQTMPIELKLQPGSEGVQN